MKKQPVWRMYTKVRLMMLRTSINKPATEYIKQALIGFSIDCLNDVDLTGYYGDVTNDSRKVSQGSTTGDIFCAVIGHAQDGRQYIEKAITNGAKLVIAECVNSTEHGNVQYFEAASEKVAVVSFYQLNKQLFQLASAYYQSPEKSLTMIGLTGTNGKTSTSQLLGQTLTSLEKPCAVIGTNGTGMVDDLQPLENTTPSATDLAQLFSVYSQSKVETKDQSEQQITHLAMEVSSHALEQQRVTGNIFDIAIFTNLSRDHLDYHGNMSEYAAAKRKLFIHDGKQIAVINGDDEQAKIWISQWPTEQNLWLYGRGEIVRTHAKFVSCFNVKHHHKGVDFVLNTHLGNIEIQSPLLGDFNIDNLLAVIAVLLIEGFTLDTVAEKVSSVKAISGRMEAFLSHNTPTAVVDYAHTPDALEKALVACRQHCHGNLFVVFGCGGDRDKGKRPLMAQVAQKYADRLVVTNDNPRTEKPMSIIDDILAGLEGDCSVKVIVDREQAVLATLAEAKANDVVLLAGKGHEDYVILGHQKIAYNEREVVKSFFENIEENTLAGESK